jgi:hypothetical protein
MSKPGCDAQIAALRAEVKSVRALHLGTEKGLIAQRDAAESRVKTLEKALREIAEPFDDGHRDVCMNIAAAALKEKP